MYRRSPLIGVELMTNRNHLSHFLTQADGSNATIPTPTAFVTKVTHKLTYMPAKLPKAPPLIFKYPNKSQRTTMLTCRQSCFSLQRFSHRVNPSSLPWHVLMTPHIHPPFKTSLPTIWSTPNSLVRLRSSTHLGGPEFSSPGETVSRTYATESAPLWLRE